MEEPLVGVIMGSKLDAETMSEATRILGELGIAYEILVVSAASTSCRLRAVSITSDQTLFI